jgi:hypothetical protein
MLRAMVVRLGVLGLLSCVSEPARRNEADAAVEGLIRRREANCERGFRLAVGSVPVANQRFSVRVGSTPAGREVAGFITSDEGAFKATLPKGPLCFVDVTVADSGRCAAVLLYDPSVEPVPMVFLPAGPCP